MSNYYSLEFYPRNWQISMARTLHPWILHTTMWHYWLWFTFIFSMNLFFIYIYKTITYQRADIRGTRANGNKRRLAWPEMLVVIIPFYWAINIVTNALIYLRAIETNTNHIVLSVQVNAFQWGWRYCYSDLFYAKHLNNPVKTGFKSNVNFNGDIIHYRRNSHWNLRYRSIYEIYRKSKLKTREVHFWYYIKETEEKTHAHRWSWDISMDRSNADLTLEQYFCRRWLKSFGVIENERLRKVINKKWQNGYWITAQGLNSNTPYYNESLNSLEKKYEFTLSKDPLRLFRSSGALVLPTRSSLKLLSCSDDITHSWAVPGLGFKMDCVPGKLFSLYLNISREGVYFGQCSELCGWNHYNMPVVVYALPIEHFIIWWEIELHTTFSKKVLVNADRYQNFLKNNQCQVR